ncbi:MAG: hydroxylamine reductase [Bacillota bacterium]
MFCYQCQEAGGQKGCITQGICGKEEDTANLQDLLIYVLKGISVYLKELKNNNIKTPEIDYYIIDSLFSTITNSNFDNKMLLNKIKDGLKYKDNCWNQIQKNNIKLEENHFEAAAWNEKNEDEFFNKAKKVGVLTEMDENIRSLKEIITYGLKGIAAYTEHAYHLGYKNKEIFDFIPNTLNEITKDNLSQEKLLELVLKTGEIGVKAMQLLDKANTESFGNPEISEVNLGTNDRPGILISGHDLKDMEELLIQTKDSGIDIYTHGEMMPANYYPKLKKYDHFVGNYGSSWWNQREEIESFNGPVLFTTNCIVPPWPSNTYQDKLFTTNAAGFPNTVHIKRNKKGKKDFSPIIKMAKKCEPPKELEKGKIVGGFAHGQVSKLSDEIIEAVKNKKIHRFFVMAGCDGRFKERKYYTKFAKILPKDTIILTAGCAKYRYNKLDLGEIDGIPRILDAGQCNDSYSLVKIAQELAEKLDIEDINQLPLSFNIAWYEQKAVIIFLALLSLGIKNIKLGPTLPAFFSKNIEKVIKEKFNISTIGSVEEDLKYFLR